MCHSADDEEKVVAPGWQRHLRPIHVLDGPFPLGGEDQYQIDESEEDGYGDPDGFAERQGEEVADEGERRLAKYEGCPWIYMETGKFFFLLGYKVRHASLYIPNMFKYKGIVVNY